MAKEFYTERDIEDMFKRGITSLQVTENVVLTELAFEKATRLGVKLVRPFAEQNGPGKDRPVDPPGAPLRPYISQAMQPEAAPTPAAPLERDLAERIRAAVLAQLGGQVDPALLDVIIQRVLKSTGVK
jgi:hypothetical protein